MYAKELLKTGDKTDFTEAEPIFSSILESSTEEKACKEASCVVARCYRLCDNKNQFFKIALKDMLTTPCSEICFELGAYFEDAADYREASLWYYNAAYEAESILDIHTSGDLPLKGLVSCYKRILEEMSADESFTPDDMSGYKSALIDAKNALNNWTLPEE